MYDKFESTMTTARMIDWEQRFCPADWCMVETLYTRRNEHNLELWHVTDGEGNWLVAATGPVCPLCGGDLRHLRGNLAASQRRRITRPHH